MASTDAERLTAKIEAELRVRDALKSSLKEHAEKEREFVKWEERLHESQTQMESNIVNCDEMLRQVDAKREHAEACVTRDSEENESYALHLQGLRDQLHLIQMETASVAGEIESNSKYFEFLRRSIRVVLDRETSKTEDVYELVEEIVDRHGTLTMASEQLQNRLTAATRSHSEVVLAHNKYVETARETTLALNTRLGNMKRVLESNVWSSSASESAMTHVARKSSLRSASVSLVKTSTANIFAKCTARSHVRRCASSDAHASETIARLSVIGHFLRDMRNILEAK